MSLYPKSAAVMWPVENLPHVYEPHVTLMYLGDIDEQEVGPQELVNTLNEFFVFSAQEIKPISIEIFGEDDWSVYVATVDTRLAPEREMAVKILTEHLPVADASSYAFRPHVTLGKVSDLTEPPALPDTILLGKPEVWWGGTHYLLN